MNNLHYPYLIAEAADAHYGDMERAKLMCRLAKKSGASAIKFQHHIPDEEMLPNIPMSRNMKEPLYDFLVKNSLTISQHVELSKYCSTLEIEYLCTPFSWKAAQELESFVSPKMYKIGSGELTDLPTLLLISDFKKPMIISTGMSEIDEIKETYDKLIDRVPFLVLMNCTSAYPPKLGDINLGFISEMKDLFPRAIIGHSDHTDNIFTSLGAIALDAKFVEKHVTVDRLLTGPDQTVSITFEEFEQLVIGAKILSESLGKTKKILDSEREIIQWARRSLVFLVDKKIGDLIVPGDIWGKRPGTGIPSKNIGEFYGRRLKKNVKANTLLNFEDLE